MKWFHDLLWLLGIRSFCKKHECEILQELQAVHELVEQLNRKLKVCREKNCEKRHDQSC